MMKTKIKGGSVVAAVLCVIVSLFALMLLGANATQMVGLLEADSLLNQGYVNAALNKVSQASEANASLNDSDFISNLSKTLGNQTIFTLGYGETAMTAKIYIRFSRTMPTPKRRISPTTILSRSLTLSRVRTELRISILNTTSAISR